MMKNIPTVRPWQTWQLEKLALGVCICAGTLIGCGKSTPSVADLQPALMSDIGQCDLWTVSDIKKVDGIPGKESYRVDFSAKLTIKGTPEEALQKLNAHSMDPNWLGCLMVSGRLAARDMSLWKTYDVTGAGEFVKSEKGWRLLGELGQYAFSPTPGQAESERAFLRPVGQPNAQVSSAVSVPPVAQAAAEPAPVEPALSPCVAAKMTQYDAQRNREIDEIGKVARARGEEVQISAGPEELMRQEALDKATADCK